MRLNIGRYGSYEVVEVAPWPEVNLDNTCPRSASSRIPPSAASAGAGTDFNPHHPLISPCQRSQYSIRAKAT